MEQKKILLKSFDVQPFQNQDEYIDVELFCSTKEIKQNYLSNNFDLQKQYNSERNNSRKFFVYGRLFAKQTDTNGLIVTLSTLDNDILYFPNKENNILPPNTKSISVVANTVVKNTDLSLNIFGNIESSYYFQFEIDGSNLDSGTTKNANINVSGTNVNNNISTLLIYFDSDNEFVPYGTVDTVFDSNFELIEINNNFPFLYDYHWVKQNIDVVTFNNVYFPFNQFQDNYGNTIIDNSTRITDANLNPTFQLLMDYPSFFGLEKATLNVIKSVAPRNNFYVPLQYFNSQKFENYSPWEGSPQNQYQWNLVGGALNNIRNVIINNPASYSNLKTFNTSQQFYNANIGFYLSYFEGSNLNIQNTNALYDNLIIQGFLNYSSSIYKKDVSKTSIGEFVSGFTIDTGQIIDVVDISFNKGNTSENYSIELSGVTFYNELDYLSVVFDSVNNIDIGVPNSYLINVVAENKKPTAYFKISTDNVYAENLDYYLEVDLDKPYQGINPVTLSLSVLADKTTAVSLDQAIQQYPNYPFTVGFSTSGDTQHDYEIILDSVSLTQGSSKAVFKIRIYYSNYYYLTKNLTLQISSSTSDILIDPLNNLFSLQINSSVVPGWTKYQFPADDLAGIGIFRSNRVVGYSNANYLLELESPQINNTANRLNFTPNFNYTISCINAGDTEIAYGGDYGGQQQNVLPGQTVFSVQSSQNFEQFDFVLPSNANLIENHDVTNGKITPKYLKSKYEFRIENIDPVDLTVSGTSSYFNDIIIPAQEITAFSNTTLNNYNQWKNYINSIDFFDTTQTGISTTFITEDYPTNLGQYSLTLNQLNKSVFILKTGVANIYYPTPSSSDRNAISQLIDTSSSNTTNGLTSVFGTLIINDSVINNSGIGVHLFNGSTFISYRAFTNDRNSKNLLVPAQTSINPIQTDSDAAGLAKFFNFYYSESNTVYSTNPSYHNGKQFSSDVLKHINFNPALETGINSFEDNVVGIKPLPVYEYTSDNLLIV